MAITPLFYLSRSDGPRTTHGAKAHLGEHGQWGDREKGREETTQTIGLDRNIDESTIEPDRSAHENAALDPGVEFFTIDRKLGHLR